jgi:Fic family protein
MLYLHRLLMRLTGDPLAGALRRDPNVIGDRHAEGSVTVIFKTVPPEQVEGQLSELVAGYEQARAHGHVPPLLAVAVLILDFLAIHPFQDGNSRVARLLTTCELLRSGYGVARYVSIEQRIFESKHSYYAALRAGQAGWHDAQHEVWPWVRYLLTMIAEAYNDFEQKVAAGTTLVGGTKHEQARNYILSRAPRAFRLAQIFDALPDISDATIRAAADALRDEGVLKVGRGRSAVWERVED